MNPKTPPPANFTDPERMAGLSPFKAFNTASFGVEGTAMASFAAFSEEQRWQVAFYVMSLRFHPEQVARGAALMRREKIAGGFDFRGQSGDRTPMNSCPNSLKKYFDRRSSSQRRARLFAPRHARTESRRTRWL